MSTSRVPLVPSGNGWQQLSWEAVFAALHTIAPWLANELTEPAHLWPARIDDIARQQNRDLNWQWILGITQPDRVFSEYLWEEEKLLAFFLEQLPPITTAIFVLDSPPNLGIRLAIQVECLGRWESFFEEFPYQIFGSGDIFLIFPEVAVALAVHHSGVFFHLEQAAKDTTSPTSRS